MDGSRSKFNRRRRGFMQAVSAASMMMAGGFSATEYSRPEHADDPWEQAQRIVDRLAMPIPFRDQDFPITAYGAASCTLVQVKAWVSNDLQSTLNTPAAEAKDCYLAIAAAIVACHKAGGGRVVVPAGNWYCAGPITLLSNVHMHLQVGAQIFFSSDPADYAKYGSFDCGRNGKLVLARWQGNDCLNFSPMVYAYGQDNIAVTGEDWTSILNGQAGVPFVGSASGKDCWWTWKGRAANHPLAPGTSQIYVKGAPSEIVPNALNPASLSAIAPGIAAAQAALIEGENSRWRGDFGFAPALSEAAVPVEKRIFGLGHYLRPSMIQFIGCTNVLLQGYQVVNTPFWQHNPVNCRNLTIRKVYANSLGPNNDGFDPESCDHVLIDSCTFNSGDDCIAIKSGKDLDTEYGPSQNIVIQNCTMQSGHGALTLGSEMAGGIQNVYAQNLVFQNVNWASNPLNIAIRLKTNLNRGGYLRNFYVRNVTVPNGVQTRPGFYQALDGSPIAPKSVATSAGGLITIDCDYAPHEDNVRIRPPTVSNVHITGFKAGNVAAKDGQYSCYQALVIQGPVAADYNGVEPRPQILPVNDITISDCDFGTPSNSTHPYYVFNAHNIVLKDVIIGGKLYNTVLAT